MALWLSPFFSEATVGIAKRKAQNIPPDEPAFQILTLSADPPALSNLIALSATGSFFRVHPYFALMRQDCVSPLSMLEDRGAAARVCREAGGRVASKLFVRNMDMGLPRAGDSRRLKVVVDGLPLYSGVQLAVDTTLVSAFEGDGEPRRSVADHDGFAFAAARRDEERERTSSLPLPLPHPELVGLGARARLVVLALEVGGRWSEEAKIFLRLLARARARSEPRLTQRRE